MNRTKALESLRKVLIEFAIIFVGVVLAFQFESYRLSKVEDRSEASLLEGLKEDVHKTIESLDWNISQQETMLDNSKILLSHVESSSSYPTVENLQNAFFGSFSFFREEAVSGAYDAMISAGNIGIIKNDSLRTELSKFFSNINTGWEDEVNAQFAHQQLLLAASEYMTPLTPAGLREAAGLPPWSGKPEMAATKLLHDSHFGSVLLLRIVYERQRLGRQKGLRTKANNVLKMINAELSDR